jgi:hypothetical protein
MVAGLRRPVDEVFKGDFHVLAIPKIRKVPTAMKPK